MQWIYVLKCEDDYYYVGQTKRLFRRFWEHSEGNGGVNTSQFEPYELAAIYKVNDIGKFTDYNEYVYKINNGYWHDNYELAKLYFYNKDENDCEHDKFEAENNIVECLITHNRDNWKKYRGGKYVRFDCEYKYPENSYIKHLPLCNCGLPCHIKKNDDKNFLYFRCAKKNFWGNLEEVCELETQEPCTFYREYNEDIILRTEAVIKRKNKYKRKDPLLKGKCLIKL